MMKNGEVCYHVSALITANAVALALAFVLTLTVGPLWAVVGVAMPWLAAIVPAVYRAFTVEVMV